MKKIIISMLCIMAVLSGCGSNGVAEKTGNETNQQSSPVHEDNVKETETSDSISQKRMVMLKGKYYVDTGELGISPTCGVMDFSFEKKTNGIPTRNGQTNFGKGYEGQYYIRENRIMIMIDGKPCVFAHQENDSEFLEMSVVKFSKTKAEIQIKNSSESDGYYSDIFYMEYFDEQSDIWRPVEKIVENISNESGSNDVEYMIKGESESNITIKWKALYGALNEGRYRIIKEISHLQRKCVGFSSVYTLSAEFAITK